MTDPLAPLSGAFAGSCSRPRTCTAGLVSRSSSSLLTPFRKERRGFPALSRPWPWFLGPQESGSSRSHG